MVQIPSITRLIPVPIAGTGKIGKALFRILETIAPLKTNREYKIENPDISINPKNSSERFLFYFFYNMINHYKTTPLFQYMSKNLRPNDPFVDIGANVGIYSYLARELGAVSYAFEPEPMHYLFLSRNKAFCDRAYDIALSDHEGFSPFFISEDTHHYGSSLVPSRKGWEQSGYRVSKTVKTDRLDNLFSPKEASRFQFIKIDVEGAEEAVLMGMKGLLEGTFRGPIWCEVRGDQSDRNPGSYREVTRFLSNYDYIPYIYKNFSKHTFTDTDARQVFDLLFEKAMHVS